VAEIDRITIGSGKVIPSSQIQIIQNLEGGILSKMLVREGNDVKAGQILMRLDDTEATSKLGEDRAQYLGLSAIRARLEAEVEGRDIAISDEIMRLAPHIAANETALFESRISELNAALSALEERKLQKDQEVQETKSSIEQNTRSLDLSREEIEITKPMVEQGITSRVELLQLERSFNELEGKLNGLKLSLPKTEAALREAGQKYHEAKAAFRSRALKDLNETTVKLNAIKETMTSGGERVNRTEIRSPVTGTVKRIYINTVGGVIQPGMSIMEIVPIDDVLLLEAEIAPADIAGLHPGQQARVKISAYDYTIHGALEATLDHISADTITDDEGRNFYLIRVSTTDSELKSKTGETLPIIAGMTAQVDILTGKRTVLEYLMKPILRARELALREK
ncbi:MAG: HlyD family type I secretion periplasmic adaptor subunit, partial [Rhodospirillaceae bacterium]|nr:HlyD family type I secretion periplasmic adaptor subunit [Rhodospirillaceae bacterium]